MLARTVICTGLLLACLAPTGRAEEASALDAVQEAFHAGDYASVVELAAAIPEDDADHRKACYLTGEAQLLLGNAGAAAAAFRQVLAANPDSVPALTGLGRALASLDEPKEAERTLRRAVKLDRKNAFALRSLGEFLVAEDRLAEGATCLELAVRRDPRDPLAARAAVEALVRLEKLDRARKIARTVRRARPEHPMGDFLTGIVLDRDGKVDEAIAAYEAAIAKDDTFIDAHKNLAILCTTQNPMYSMKERTEKALTHYERYFELGGQDEELRQIYQSIRSFIDG
jgi:tetratricopeptide (TPR) repeat protein